MFVMKNADKIYMDVCSLCRPFDDQHYLRIRLETNAVNLILTKVKDSHLELINSPVLIKEIESIDDDLERTELLQLLNKYGKIYNFKADILKNRIETLISLRFGIADAAHIAFAEYYNAIFITCDDKLLNKCKKYINIIPSYNPVIFCEKEKLK